MPESYQRLYSSDVKHIEANLEKFIKDKENTLRNRFTYDNENRR